MGRQVGAGASLVLIHAVRAHRHVPMGAKGARSRCMGLVRRECMARSFEVRKAGLGPVIVDGGSLAAETSLSTKEARIL
jgi:hypothetical protein